MRELSVCACALRGPQIAILPPVCCSVGDSNSTQGEEVYVRVCVLYVCVRSSCTTDSNPPAAWEITAAALATGCQCSAANTDGYKRLSREIWAFSAGT